MEAFEISNFDLEISISRFQVQNSLVTPGFPPFCFVPPQNPAAEPCQCLAAYIASEGGQVHHQRIALPAGNSMG